MDEKPINPGFGAIVKEVQGPLDDIRPLPICHVTTPGGFERMTRDMKLVAQEESDEKKDRRGKKNKEKPYGKERILYFFYGKASYIFNGEALPVYLVGSPVAIIFELEALTEESKEIHRMLPFDSGGFHRYKISSGFTKEDFTIYSPTEEILRKYVKLMYGTNDNYLNLRVKTPPDDQTSKSQVFNEIINIHNEANIGKAEFGEQGVTIELQFKDVEIKFKPKVILVPFAYSSRFNKNGTTKRLQDMGVAVVPYFDREKTLTPMDEFAFMKEKVYNVVSQMVNPQAMVNPQTGGISA